MATAAGFGLGCQARALKGLRALLDPGGRAGGDVPMQLAHGEHPVAQGRNLAEHVEAVGRLFGVGHGDKRRAGPVAAVDPLGRDPEAARVQSLERLADLVVWLAQRQQALALRREPVDERRRADAHQVARPGFQEHGLAAVGGPRPGTAATIAPVVTASRVKR